MIIESKGIYINNCYIPPFSVDEGEILIIDICKDIPFYKFEQSFADILSGKKIDENIMITSPFLFSGRVWHESWLKSIFSPTTIKKYIGYYTHDSKKIIEKINNLDSNYLELRLMKKDDKMASLEATPFRLLSLFAVLAKSKFIITDMLGQSLDGIELTWNIVNENIDNGGCCIIFDYKGHSNYVKFAKRFQKIEI